MFARPGRPSSSAPGPSSPTPTMTSFGTPAARGLQTARQGRTTRRGPALGATCHFEKKPRASAALRRGSAWSQGAGCRVQGAGHPPQGGQLRPLGRAASAPRTHAPPPSITHGSFPLLEQSCVAYRKTLSVLLAHTCMCGSAWYVWQYAHACMWVSLPCAAHSAMGGGVCKSTRRTRRCCSPIRACAGQPAMRTARGGGGGGARQQGGHGARSTASTVICLVYVRVLVPDCTPPNAPPHSTPPHACAGTCDPNGTTTAPHAPCQRPAPVGWLPTPASSRGVRTAKPPWLDFGLTL